MKLCVTTKSVGSRLIHLHRLLFRKRVAVPTPLALLLGRAALLLPLLLFLPLHPVDDRRMVATSRVVMSNAFHTSSVSFADEYALKVADKTSFLL
jgi:hypothetical protein